jgi:purine-binding chemotaxis protein CheW
MPAHDKTIAVFRIGAERYGVTTDVAREVVPASHPRPVPGADAWVRGVINLRGGIVPVCDVRLALGLEGIEGDGQVLVCDTAEGTIGIVVDEVIGVERVAGNEISPSDKSWHPALTGLVQRGDELVILLDLDRAFYRDIDSEEGALAA